MPASISRFAIYDTYDETSPLVSRFSIAILSSVLLGMALGRLLMPSVEVMTGAAGALGLFYYGYRMWYIHRRWEMLQAAHRSRVEHRLSTLASLKEVPVLSSAPTHDPVLNHA